MVGRKISLDSAEWVVDVRRNNAYCYHNVRILRIDNFSKRLLWQYARNFVLPMWRNLNSGVPEIVACRIRNPEMFSCKSGILAFCRVWNTAQGIRNPTNDWNQESKFHWQESGIQSLESRIRSLESTIQDVLGFSYLKIGLNPLGCVFPLTGQEIWKRSFFMKKANRFKLTIGQIRKGDIYVYFDNSRSLVF